MTPSEIDALAERVAEKVARELRKSPSLVDRVELARQLGVSVPTIERASAKGEIPFVRLGRRVLYDPAAVIRARMEKGGADHE